jgi:SAM-dependent methyltransferase
VKYPSQYNSCSFVNDFFIFTTINKKSKINCNTMGNLNTLIEKQYHKNELYEDIVQRLKEQGIDLDHVTRDNIAKVDEFHLRGPTVTQELLTAIDPQNFKVLDVGCGIGGPCRMFADEFDCTVTGVDISEEYIRTAQHLSKLVNLDDKTEFIKGDACALPFEDETYDLVWTQHAQMNIKDKEAFYDEINRVLKKGGWFVYYDIFNIDGKEVQYPVPWADTPDVSFLVSQDQTHDLLKELGMERKQTTDHTRKAIDFLHGVFEKIKQEGPPKMGLNVLIGKTTKEKLQNVLEGLENQKIMVESSTYQKKT